MVYNTPNASSTPGNDDQTDGLEYLAVVVMFSVDLHYCYNHILYVSFVVQNYLAVVYY